MPSLLPSIPTGSPRRCLPGRLTEINLLWELARTGDASALADLHRHAHQLSEADDRSEPGPLATAARVLDTSLAAFQSDPRELDGLWADRIGADVAALSTAAQADPAPPAAHRDAVVLIADDDPGVRDLLSRCLEHEGLLTLTAANGVEAVQQVRTHAPDVVLMDLEMPEMTGIEAIRQLRAEDASRDLPVIVLTADDETDTVLRVLSLDVNGYLSKPADPRHVVDKVYATLLAAS